MIPGQIFIVLYESSRGRVSQGGDGNPRQPYGTSSSSITKHRLDKPISPQARPCRATLIKTRLPPAVIRFFAPNDGTFERRRAQVCDTRPRRRRMEVRGGRIRPPQFVTLNHRYEMRRECQEILPGLLLGPFVASKSLETLQSLGITHM